MLSGLAVLGPARATEVAVDLELVLAVDISGSIDAEEGELQRLGYIAALRDPLLHQAIAAGRKGAIAVTYFEWAGHAQQRPLVGWRLIQTPADAAAFAEALAATARTGLRRTSISGAIAFALPLFEDNGFKGDRRVIDISGDGPNNDGAYILQARNLALAAGVTINGLPIVNQRPNQFGYPQLEDLDLYYEACVIGGPGAFIVVARGFKDFARAIRRKLILEIAARPAAPRAMPLKQAVIAPSCDIGERQLYEYLEQNPF